MAFWGLVLYRPLLTDRRAVEGDRMSLLTYTAITSIRLDPVELLPKAHELEFRANAAGFVVRR